MAGTGSAGRPFEVKEKPDDLFEQAHAPMVVIDANGEIAVANAAFRALAGARSAELGGQPFIERFAPAYRDRVSATLARISVEQTPHERMQVAFVDGRVVHLECFGRAHVNGPGSSLWTFSDVTERELRNRAAERYELFSRHTQDIVLFIRRDGRIIEANDAAVSAYGYTREELLQLRIDDLRAPSTREIVAQQIDEALTRGIRLETMHFRKDGSQFPVEVGSRAAMIGEDPILLSIIRDISGRSQLQAKIIQADRMAALGTMAAGIVHEVNNPLAYTMANLQMAKKRLGQLTTSLGAMGHADITSEAVARDMRELLEMLELAHEGTQRVRSIIDDLRAFSRNDDSANETIELASVVDAAVEIASSEIRDRAKLVRSYGQAPSVRASAQRLTQVFLNLVLNAAQAIPEGHPDENEIRIAIATGPSGDAVVEVEDTGRGISTELQPRIFDAFFTTKALGEGTGLGLFISRTIVTSYGGDITVESAKDRGTRFRVCLPEDRPVASSRPLP